MNRCCIHFNFLLEVDTLFCLFPNNYASCFTILSRCDKNDSKSNVKNNEMSILKFAKANGKNECGEII